MFMSRLFNYVEIAALLLPLPKASDWPNKKETGQQLGRGGIGGAGRREKREANQPVASLRGTSQPDMEEAGKQDGQYVDEVNEPWGNIQINRNGLI